MMIDNFEQLPFVQNWLIINRYRYMSQHQKIQRYVIKSTPFGQLAEVLKDLDKLSPIDATSPAMSATIQQYNQQHLAIVSGSQGQVLIMPNSKVGPNQYICQNKQQVYSVDHVKLQILSVQNTEVELVPEVKELIKHLSTEVQAYVDKYYKSPNGSQVHADIGEEGLTVYIGLTSKNISIAKFYTGEWISKWKITKDQIQGVVTIKAHFFEAGNVQFNQKRQLKQKFQFSADMQESAKTISKIIEAFQAKVQSQLEVVYQQMPNKFFKKLRRLAPYTKTKMTWNINSIKMNQNLLGNKQ